MPPRRTAFLDRCRIQPASWLAYRVSQMIQTFLELLETRRHVYVPPFRLGHEFGYVDSLRTPLVVHAAEQEFLDSDRSRLITIQQMKDTNCIIHLEANRCKVKSHFLLIEVVLKLLQRELAVAVPIGLHEDLP